jgi:16S rRNA (guanine527-N7)-methyltransferase
VNIILKYFPEITAEQKDQFSRMGSVYMEWNEKVNLISRKDLENFYERHVLHSLSLIRIIDFEPGTTILDAGTGGGFPGIPLAIIFPECHFHLVDSTRKKLKAVESISENLGLKNITTEHTRLENLRGSYDFIASRAVTTLPKIWELTNKNISKDSFNELPNGIFYLKGGDIDKEIRGVPAKAVIYEVSEFFEEEFFKSKKAIHLHQ